MGANGHQLQHRNVRRDHRPPSGEGVGRRTRRRRNNHPVSGNIHRGVTTDGHFKVTHTRQGFPMQHHFVQTQGFPHHRVFPHQPDDGHGALFDLILAGDRRFDGRIQLRQIGFGQKTHMTGIHAQQRQTNRRNLSKGRQNRAISSQDNAKVHIGGKSGGN